jgi:outer membrane protein assembly factor BamB
MMALIEASPGGYAEKGTFMLPSVNGPSWPHPVIHAGKLYIRDQDVLLCYELKP